MPKLVLAIGADAAKVEAVEGFANYSGPTPPAGLYPAVIKQIAVQQSKTSKKPMLRAIIEFKSAKNDARFKFNGYSIFHYLVIPESKEEEYYGLQVGQINRMLDAMSGNTPAVRQKFWGNEAVTDAEGKKIIRIGTVSLGKEGVPIVVSAKLDTFNRKVIDPKTKKPVIDPKTGKAKTEEVTNLRVNDLLPKGDPKGDRLSDEQEDKFEEADDAAFVDDDSADADSGLDDPADSSQSDNSSAGGDDEGWADADDAAADESEADSEDSSSEGTDEDDSAELIAEMVPEEPAEEPAPKRRRRTAF